MRPYLALARFSAKRALTYRMNFALALFGVVFQFIAMLAVWRALLGDSSLQGFTWPQMREYLLIAFASGTLVSFFADLSMAERIRDGLVALDLVKPVRYQEARFAEVLGGVWIEACIVLVVGSVTLAAFGEPVWPRGASIALFAISMLLLIVIKFLVLYLCGLLCFWTQNYIGVQWARIALVNLLSGALVPLAYFPGWFGAIATWSPFGGMTSTPGLIFIGNVTGADAALLVAVQLGWVVAFWFAAKSAFRFAVRQLTVNGG